MAKARPTNIKIRSIDLTAFNDKSQGVVVTGKLGFRVKLQITVVPITNSVSIITNLEIGDAKFEAILGNIETRGEYIINENQPDNGLGDIEYQKQILPTVVGTQLSTTRGMLLIVAKGTPLIQTVLPIMPANVLRNFIENSIFKGEASIEAKPTKI